MTGKHNGVFRQGTELLVAFEEIPQGITVRLVRLQDDGWRDLGQDLIAAD